MSCADFERRVALYAGGDLDAASSRDVERHLIACAACRDLLTALRGQREAMGDWRSAELSQDALDDVRQGVLAAIARGDARRSLFDSMRFTPFRSMAWGSAGLAAAATLVMGVWVGVSRTDDPQPAPRVAAQSAGVETPASADTAGRPAEPAAAEPRSEARGEVPAPPSRATDAAKERLIARSRPEATRIATAGVSLASASPAGAAEARPAAVVPTAPPSPMRRIEFQTADPNIRIIWLMPDAAPDPAKSAAGR